MPNYRASGFRYHISICKAFEKQRLALIFGLIVQALNDLVR